MQNALEQRYQDHLEALTIGCGDICQDSQTGVPSLYFNFIEKPNFQCDALCTNAAIDRGSLESQSPQVIPDSMLSLFTYGGRVPVVPFREFFDQRYLGSDARLAVWTKKDVDDMTEMASSRSLVGNYGINETNWVIEGLEQANVRGKHVLVIGSENPWVEACVLNAGAEHVTTLEYGRIVSEHPKISTLTPDEMRAQYTGRYSEFFGAVVTFSSVEHSGLGRYGDALNPWGDRQALARAWCMAKPGARLLIGVMCGAHDVIEFNAHRVYSSLTFSHLLANWKQIWRAPGGNQVVHVLKKYATDPASSLPNSSATADATILIVPLRDREVQWAAMRQHMCEFWRPSWPPLEIWAVRQEDDALPFNRGWLFNVGLRLIGSGSCVALHDVDLLPLEGVDYAACERPVHLSSEPENHNWRPPYAHFSGGVFLASPDHWRRINGLSNEFWGWGCEDDELFHRWRRAGLVANESAPHRPPPGRGRFRQNWVGHNRGERDEREFQRNMRLAAEVKPGIRRPASLMSEYSY
jgi:hypothetical protein